MCGICGIAGLEARAGDAPLEEMRDTMLHRGPDAGGLWVDSSGTVGLAHRRLAIIDLSPRGCQPMTDADGAFQIVFNGEIYNFKELREELRRDGASFHTDSDTEVILEAYRKWGDDCVSHLNGMFAFALYDRRRSRVLLARDRAGKKPLFYSHRPGVLMFASELKALLRHPATSRALDADAVNYYFAFGYVPGDRCIVKGIRKLPQGHRMSYDVRFDTLDITRYWRLPAQDDSLDTEDALTDELERLLSDAVQTRMVADVPVGILLSGGLDSSIVAALAARTSTSRIRTFNVSMPGYASLDEGPYARRVAEFLGTDHVELQVQADAGGDLLPRLAHQFDEPVADTSIIPMYLLSRAVRERATVALGGDGGDELFGGYPHYSYLQRIESVRQWIPGIARRPVALAAARLPMGTRGRSHLMALGGSLSDSLAHINLYFDAETRHRLLAPLHISGQDTTPEEYKRSLFSRGSVVQSATRMDFMTTMVDDYLVKVDRASMLASLEVRAPFLDHRLIEFAFGRVPDRFKATVSERKVLLRRLGQRLLPPDLDTRRKQGFVIPMAEWLRNDWRGLVSDVVAGIDPRILDVGVVKTVLAGHQRGLPNTQRIFAILLFELWRREHRISVG